MDIDNQKKKIAVIGDIILDEFIFGSVERINPEAPVPILNIKKKEFRLGGASNVANNIVSLGGDCILIGKTGNNKILKELLDFKKIKHDLIIDKSIRSIKKTRFIANNQQLLRVDDEEINIPLDEDIEIIAEKAKSADIVIISDYAKGTINIKLMDRLRKLDKKIIVDPKHSDPDMFKDVFLLKPNLKEARTILNIDANLQIELGELGEKLQNHFNSNILITKGKGGMSLFEIGKKTIHLPAKAKEVYDVTGAGDTVIATIGLALALDKPLEEAVNLANNAAAIVVSKVGTATINKEELFLG